MFGFPIPYSNELIYSLIARVGVHEGETSPKRLLDLVFGNRNIKATVDLPSHINIISKQYSPAQNYTPKRLAIEHTLYPIYSHFITSERAKLLLNWLREDSHGAAHSGSGMAASRVQTKMSMCICPECLQVQKSSFGEPFWDRRWQVPLVKVCPIHGPLYETNINTNAEHRHAFIPVSDARICSRFKSDKSDYRFSKIVYDFFNVLPDGSPSFQQWSAFYQQLARRMGLTVGARIDHRTINISIVHHWGEEWLKCSAVMPTKNDSSWLKTIFRKHRKSFSFVEHALVIDAVTHGEMTLSDAVDQARRIVPPQSSEAGERVNQSSLWLTKDQTQWLALVESLSPKQARAQNKALYARLYRNQYGWLMYVNKQYAEALIHPSNRVDWQLRDRIAAKAIKSTLVHIEGDISSPRVSRAYLLSQLPNRTIIEKNLHRLRRCSVLLEYYSESITEYQTRRLTVVVRDMRDQGRELKEWILLREAGLSDDRITSISRRLLKEILANAEES